MNDSIAQSHGPQTVVIKVGGALLESKGAALAFFKQLKNLAAHSPDLSPVVVHGGGAQVQTLLTDLGMTSQKRDGVRITPAEHMPYVAGVLAGTVNKQLVAYAQSVGCKTVGISVVDGNLMQSKIADPAFGRVGVPAETDGRLVVDLLKANWMPVIASIGADADGELVNINADHAASGIACALSCPLVLLSDVAAVLDENKQRIPLINDASLSTLIEDGTIVDGMKVKVNSAMTTAKETGQAVTIASWKDDIHAILQGELGTQIVASAHAQV